MLLSSSQNPHIKLIKSLQEKSRKRRLEKKFVVEGEKEILHAIDGGYKLLSLFHVHKEHLNIESFSKFNEVKIFSVEYTLFEQLCYRKTSEFIAIFEIEEHHLSQISLINQNPFILIAESPEKPGNIGALLRTADAFSIDLVIIVNPKTDLYNPNVIRSSVGCLFTVPVVTGTVNEVIEFLKNNKITVYNAAFGQEAVEYTKADYTKALGIAVGTEDVGLSIDWLEQIGQQVFIPMQGKNDSLNVSVAAGILLAEVRRQRNP